MFGCGDWHVKESWNISFRRKQDNIKAIVMRFAVMNWNTVWLYIMRQRNRCAMREQRCSLRRRPGMIMSGHETSRWNLGLDEEQGHCEDLFWQGYRCRRAVLGELFEPRSKIRPKGYFFCESGSLKRQAVLVLKCDDNSNHLINNVNALYWEVIAKFFSQNCLWQSSFECWFTHEE